MSYHRYVSAHNRDTASDGIKILKSYQDMLSLLQTVVSAGRQTVDMLDKISGYVSRIESFENAALRMEFIAQMINKIDQLADNTNYRGHALLNGSSGVTGKSSDSRIQIIRCGHSKFVKKNALVSVKIHQSPMRAFCRSSIPLTDKSVKTTDYLYVEVKNKHYEFDVRTIVSTDQFLSHLRQFIMFSGLDLDFGVDEDEMLVFHQQQPGKANRFAVLSSNTKLFTDGKGNYKESTHGRDIIATVDNKPTVGIGNFIVAGHQKQYLDGLILHFNDMSIQAGETVGYVKMRDQSWIYKNDAEKHYKITLPSLKSSELGIGLRNESGFKNLSDIRPENARQRVDALNMTLWVKEDVLHLVDYWGKSEHFVKKLCQTELKTKLDGMLPKKNRLGNVYEAKKISGDIYAETDTGKHARIQLYT